MATRYDALLGAVPVLLVGGWLARPTLALAPWVEPGSIPYTVLGLLGAALTVGVALVHGPNHRVDS